MRNSRVVLALLLSLSYGASALAQWNDDAGGDAQGGICRPGEDCPQFPFPGGGGDENDHGGGAPVDPSPYDPLPGGGGHGGHYPGHPGGGLRDREEVYLGQYFRDQSLDLVRLLRLQNHYGQRIETIQISVRPGDNYTSLALIADGYQEDTSSAYSNFIILHPRRDLTLGQTVRDLRLQIRGKLYIDRIAVNLDGGYQPNPPPYPPGGGSQVNLPGYVNQTFYSPGNVDIAALTALYQYRGYRVEAVTVYGQGLNGYTARARLLINGMVAGQLNFGNYTSGQKIRIQQNIVVGQNLNGLNLVIDDRAFIERVEVQLRRY